MTLASLFFYGYWNPAYLILLLLSISINYVIGHSITRTPTRSDQAKILLIGGTIINLAVLGYYKYANFFARSLDQALEIELPKMDVILPLAISFYTFTQVAYLVDAYRGETKETNYNFINYTLFISFFPQLIAGPILRHNELIPQFEKEKNLGFCDRNFARGLTLFILGLSKKVLIADSLSPWVATVFDHADAVSYLEAWIGAFSYTLQLYFDFSGYSDMAIGLGWMVNINLPINFNSPYKSTSIEEFWRRWHMTLSAFLRDYLYIPLGGNRLGKLRRYLNLMITMLLGGLWHGAGWTFVIWGGLHGLFLVIHQLWRRQGRSLPKILGGIITFFAVLVSWVLFRSRNFHEASDILLTMSGVNGIILPESFQGLVGWLPAWIPFQVGPKLNYLPEGGAQNSILTLIVLMLSVVLLPNTQEIMERFKPSFWTIGIVSTFATLSFLFLNRVSEFLYFQF